MQTKKGNKRGHSKPSLLITGNSMYCTTATALLLISPLARLKNLIHEAQCIISVSQLQVVLGSPAYYYEEPGNPQFQPRVHQGASRSLGGLLAIPNMLFNNVVKTGLGICIECYVLRMDKSEIAFF